jgi:hypothetical protein
VVCVCVCVCVCVGVVEGCPAVCWSGRGEGGWAWDLSLLLEGEDDFVDALGGSVNEYDGFRTAFEEEYTTNLSAAAGGNRMQRDFGGCPQVAGAGRWS